MAWNTKNKLVTVLRLSTFQIRQINQTSQQLRFLLVKLIIKEPFLLWPTNKFWWSTVKYSLKLQTNIIYFRQKISKGHSKIIRIFNFGTKKLHFRKESPYRENESRLKLGIHKETVRQFLSKDVLLLMNPNLLSILRLGRNSEFHEGWFCFLSLSFWRAYLELFRLSILAQYFLEVVHLHQSTICSCHLFRI